MVSRLLKGAVKPLKIHIIACFFARGYAFLMRIALYQPDIPQNAGAVFRLAACLNVPVEVIEPCGFVVDDKRIRRVAMDYGGQAKITRHTSWTEWQNRENAGRTLLLTTSGDTAYADFGFQSGDTLLLGRESAGVPREVHDFADARLIVPMAAGARSLNVVTAAAMVLGEALRQTNGFILEPDQTTE
tara:strand:+ start:1906 stop:2466 length:561 start_codon:yes stop_codon:yes gene_type:complete